MQQAAPANPVPASSPGAEVPVIAPSPAPTRPIPTPSLKPNETITWIRVERPKFKIGEIFISSFAFAGVVMAFAVVVGLVLGYFKARRRERTRMGFDFHGTS